MIAIVTGQESSSDFIIAALFAVLKSLHMAGEPVSETETDGPPARSSAGLSASAAATIAVGSPFAPAVTTAVCPSAEMLAPGRGRCTEATRPSPASRRSTRSSACRNSGADVVTDREWTTTVSAELDRPAKLLSDQRPGLHRLGAVRLPSGAGERRLDLRGERRQRDGDDRPRDGDRSHVFGGEAAEPADRADGLQLGAERHRPVWALGVEEDRHAGDGTAGRPPVHRAFARSFDGAAARTG